MKNRILTIISTIIMLFTFTACNDEFLSTVPTESVDAGSAFATTKNASAAINGIYRSLVVRYLGSQGHFGHPAVMLIMDHMGEDLMNGAASASWHVAETRWVAHRTDNTVGVRLPYEMYYRVIANANLAIENIPNAKGIQADKDQILGEALGLRAWSYFNLIQLYGKRYNAAAKPNSTLGVPLVLKPTIDGLPRSTVEEVYTQIVKDLEEAAKLLKATRTYKSHINIDVIKGIQARVALTQQNWEAAATFAKDARKSYPIMNEAAYQEGFVNIANSEWMWGFDHLEDQSEFFGAYHSYVSCNYNSTVIRTYPKIINSKLYDQIPASDVRSKMWLKAPTAATAVTPPGGIRPAYMNQKFRLPGVPSTSTMGDIPYMRSSEMVLIEAEALARQGKDADAAKVLLELVGKRDATAKISANTGEKLVDEIMYNRRIELWGEGFRFLDLKRTNTPLNRNGANHIQAITTLFDVPAGDIKWEWLIPRTELDANKAMVQNPL